MHACTLLTTHNMQMSSLVPELIEAKVVGGVEVMTSLTPVPSVLIRSSRSVDRISSGPLYVPVEDSEDPSLFIEVSTVVCKTDGSCVVRDDSALVVSPSSVATVVSVSTNVVITCVDTLVVAVEPGVDSSSGASVGNF